MEDSWPTDLERGLVGGRGSRHFLLADFDACRVEGHVDGAFRHTVFLVLAFLDLQQTGDVERVALFDVGCRIEPGRVVRLALFPTGLERLEQGHPFAVEEDTLDGGVTKVDDCQEFLLSREI